MGSDEFALCTVYKGRRLFEAYLESCGLLLATKTLGVGSAAWLVVVSYWVMECDSFCSVPQATWGRGGRDAKGIYVGLCHEFGDFEL